MIRTTAAFDRRVTSPLRVSAGSFLCGVALMFGANAGAAIIQDQPAAEGPVATLRVQTNLVQIPVLVLDEFREKLHAPVAADRFVIRVGKGAWVRPRYARLEGEDPIDLAIVVDPRGQPTDLMPRLSQSIAALAPSSLSSRDRVSLYVMGCSVLHVARNIPVEPEALRSATETVVRNWKNHEGEDGGARCKPGTKVWDTLAYVALALSGTPGRRTILAITDGDDQNSQNSADELGHFARREGVSIFGLDPGPEASWGRSPGERGLSAMSESSGGITQSLAGLDVDKALQRFVAMVRDRYIVEFSRPYVAKGGEVPFEVRVTGSNFWIRTASKSVPLPNPAEAGSGMVTADKSEQRAGVIKNSPQVPAAVSEEMPAQALETQAANQRQAGSDVTPSIAAANPMQSEAVAAVVQPGLAAPGVDANLPVPTLRVASKLTIENVRVTNTNRTPVHGLTKAAFELREDGKVQAIRNFEEFQEGRGAGGASTAPAIAAGTYTNAVTAAPVGTTVNVLVMDSMTTGLTRGLAMAPENFGYARQQAMSYLKNLQAGTAVAILYLGKGVRVVQESTEDKELLLGAMKSIQYRAVLGTYAIAGGACNAANVQSEYVVEDLDEIAAYLAGIKGRKNVIWFTPGTPWLTDFVQFSRVDCLRDYTQRLDKAYALLNAAQVALNPIDPRGLVGEESFSAANRGRSVMGAFGGGLMADESSLGELAEATGGTAYFSRNDLDSAMREAIAAGADYYSLAYVPPVSGYDGKFHAISVKVSRPNLVLNYRPGYTAFDPAKVPAVTGGKAAGGEEAAQDDFSGTMRHGTVNSTGLQFDVRVTPSSAARKPGDPEVIGSPSRAVAGKHMVRYDFVYALTGDQITLVENANGGRSGSVELILAAYDADGKLLNTVGQTSKFTLKPENVAGFMKRQIQMPVQFDLPAGDVFVRVGVKDMFSERTGTLEIAEEVARK